MPTTMIGLAVTLAFSLVAFTVPTSVWATGPTLTVSADGGVHTFRLRGYVAFWHL